MTHMDIGAGSQRTSSVLASKMALLYFRARLVVGAILTWTLRLACMPKMCAQNVDFAQRQQQRLEHVSLRVTAIIRFMGQENYAVGRIKSIAVAAHSAQNPSPQQRRQQ